MHSAVHDLINQMKSRPDMIVASSGGVADNGAVPVSAFRGLRPGAFRRVGEYILAHPAENISNRVLAQLVGLSPFHFARAFKQSAGVSPHRFVLYSRVERVKHLLAETEMPLAQIALTAGFADQSHCTRQFRELVGMTPGRFRWLRR